MNQDEFNSCMKEIYEEIDARQRKIETIKFTNGFISGAILTLLLVFITNTVKADTELLIKNCLMEAEDQPMEAKIAVTHVVLNRTKHPRFPSTVEDVIKQPKQFSWVNKPSQRTIRQRDYLKCKKAVELALSCVGKNNFLYYYAVSGPNAIKEPSWARNFKTRVVIGDHLFLAGE